MANVAQALLAQILRNTNEIQSIPVVDFSPALGTHAAAAALALQNVANVCDTPEKKKRLRSVSQQALSTVKSFSGIPDPGTIEVLEMLLSSLPK